MANTTNFGWETPDDTDLVKDGAAAIRTLGSAIDTSLVDLKGGTTGQVLSKNSNTDMDFTWSSVDPLTILDAKGDLITATAADTPARLAVGTNDQVLMADSSTATGLKWGTPTSGAFTEITSTTLNNTAATYTYSSLGTYKHLFILGTSLVYDAAGNNYTFVRFNGDTASNYSYAWAGYNNTSVGGETNSGDQKISVGVTWGRTADSGLYSGRFALWIYDYRSSLTKSLYSQSAAWPGSAASTWQANGTGVWNSTSAITSITLLASTATNWKSGTIKVYGVN